MRRFPSLVLTALWFSSSASVWSRDAVEFRGDGVVVLRSAAAEVTDDRFSAAFQATRWGRYELILDFAPGTRLEETKVVCTVDEADPVEGSIRLAGEEAPDTAVGKIYIAKAGRCELAIDVPGGARRIVAARLAPAVEGEIPAQTGDQLVLLAKDCLVRGVTLRYEPAPKKNCVGFWSNPGDAVEWQFDLITPGTYALVLYQGCGKGHGGSTAAVEIAGEKRVFTVEDTGHFQNFVPRRLGTATFQTAGRHRLRVSAVEKKSVAVMDVQKIVLEKVADAVPR